MGNILSSFCRGVGFMALAAFAVLALLHPVLAAEPDLPLAAASPMAGIGFDDKPLFLPVQKNFQMAMLTAGSELGRTCGKMEAYGWRMSQSEQERVNQIFSATADRFRGLGYDVQAQAPHAVTGDISMFTADSAKKHFLSMWSAGEMGLVMVLCETGAPKGSHASASKPRMVEEPSVQTFEQNVPTATANVAATQAVPVFDKFTPVGNWVGNYICGQGYTGATLSITQLHGENFEGVFRFYPTAKNPYIQPGSYAVYGQYDHASRRILVNPGKWIQHPANYYNTIIVGNFDPITQSFSAYFQGINGCTSFEAKYRGGAKDELQHHKHVKKKHKAKKKPVATVAPAVDVKPVTAAPAALPSPAPAPTPVPAPANVAPAASAVPAPEAPPLVVGAPTPGAASPAAPPSSAPPSGFLAPAPVPVAPAK